MEKYFDGFLHYSNWGTHALKLRIPSSLLDIKTAQLYCNNNDLSVRLSDDKIILDFLSENEGDGEWEEELSLSLFLSLRTDLARGDLRCLYLGWLSGLQEDYSDENEVEPPVPAGLAELNPALIELAAFLRLDPDLIIAASKNSLSLQTASSENLRTWIATLSTSEKEGWLLDVLEAGIRGDQSAAIKLVHQFNKAQQTQKEGGENQAQGRRRIVGELFEEAELAAQTRKKMEAEKAAAEKEEKQRLHKLARNKRLNEIRGRESFLWDQIEMLVFEKKAASYDKAVELLIDLRDLATGENQSNFSAKFDAFK